MHKIDLEFQGVKYFRQYASKWDELTKRELLIYSDALLKYKDDELRITILYRFLRLPAPVFFHLKRYQLHELLPTIDFLFEKEIQTQRLIIDQIPTRFRLGKLHGPGLNFRNLTVGEYAFAETQLLKYFKSRSESDLNTLIAALYRPANLFGLLRHWFADADIRAAFNDRIAKRRARLFRRTPKHLKQAILFNFIALRTYVVSSNKEIFKADESESNQFGWAGVMHNLAGNELGTLKQIQAMLFFVALTIMKKLEADRKRIEEKYKEQNRQDN